jgi:hypothetical protein
MDFEDESSREKALERIKEANILLAKLQRERFSTLTQRCLPAYKDLDRSNPFESNFRLDPSILQVGSATFDPAEFSDAIAAVELELSVESLSRQLRLLRKRVERTFDTFLSYNSEDRSEVRTISTYLQSAGLLPWFDQNEIRPGQDWVTKLQDDITQVKSCIVVIGGSGLGPWQQIEVNSAIQMFVKRKLPVVPVVLPTCTGNPQVPLFLGAVGWVDFRKLDPDPIGELIRALK